MGFLSTTFRQSFRAATPENPRFGLNDPTAWDALGATHSAAGQPINREIALTYSPWFRGINLVSNDCAKLPLHVYRRVGQDEADGMGHGKERAINHQAYLMLRRKPNERMTAFNWKRLMISHAMSAGNGYSVIQRRGDGTPVELLPLDPEITFPVLENGRLLYVTDVAGEQRKILADDMFHLHGMGYDGLQGYPVWQKAKDALGLGIGAKRFVTTLLKNSGRPATILMHPLKLADKAKDALLAGWANMHSGIDNAGRTALLDAGLTAKEMGTSPEDMQMVATMEVSVRDIANFLGLAPHKLGDTSRTAYSSLEQENQSYLDEGLDPWLVNFEDQCHDKLLTESEKEDDSIVVEFSRKALMRANLESRANYYRVALGGQPWMNENEVRDAEGLNPTEDGNEMRRPLNTGTGGEDNAPKTPGKSGQAIKSQEEGENWARMRQPCVLAITEVVGRMVRRIGANAERAAAKGGAAFVAFVDGWQDEHHSVINEACAPAEAILRALEGEDTLPELADWIMEESALGWSNIAATTSAKDLPVKVKAEAEAQASRLPQDAAEIFVGTAPSGEGIEQTTQEGNTVVNIRLPAITVNKLPPQQVHVAAPVVHVAAPVVNVAAAEIPAPVVNVTAQAHEAAAQATKAAAAAIAAQATTTKDARAAQAAQEKATKAGEGAAQSEELATRAADAASRAAIRKPATETKTAKKLADGSIQIVGTRDGKTETKTATRMPDGSVQITTTVE